MTTITCHYDNKKINIPQSWNDLSRKQYRDICHVLGLDEESIPKYGVYTKRIVMLKILLQMSWYKFYQLTKGQIAEMLPLTDFIYESRDINVQHYPSIRVGWFRRLYGPQAKMPHTTFEEFAHADTQFTNYASTNVENRNKQSLYNMIAVMYRPKKSFHFLIKRFASDYDGDIREPFNENNVVNRAQMIKKHISDREVYGILFFYAGFRIKNVVEPHQALFPVPTESEMKQETKGSFGWRAPLYAISGSKYGTMSETKRQKWKEIITDLNMEIIQSKTQKK